MGGNFVWFLEEPLHCHPLSLKPAAASSPNQRQIQISVALNIFPRQYQLLQSLMRNSQHLLVPSAVQDVYISLWAVTVHWLVLTQRRFCHLQSPQIASHCVNGLPTAKRPPVGSGAVFAGTLHDFILVGPLSTQPLWVQTSTRRAAYFLLEAWLQSPDQESLWAEAT